MDQQQLSAEIGRRRTFAIISHPDAGKTTLTEKLLLYGGAIHLAGSVKDSRRGGRKTTSDWMEIERQRGISVSTSVLQFDYRGRRVNLLDTPGHHDFSEDTYRTLAAADAAVMLIDCVKGVEPQTIKLFKVCRLRGIPIVTFINKMDRLGREPLELLDEIERVLGIPCAPVNWPVGAGPTFAGVYERGSGRLFQFERGESKADRAVTTVGDLDSPELAEMIGDKVRDQLKEEIELLDVASRPFERGAFLRGEMTPVFFGSAMTNFGIEPFLDNFVDLAPPPGTRRTIKGERAADDPAFSAFVFKIQANMDPRHRDRIAFARVCSGRFLRGMEVLHVRSNTRLALTRSLNFLAHERKQVDEAFAGDVIGIWDPGILRIGDSLCEGEPVEFDGIPRFSPEFFVRVRLTDPAKRKQLKKGLEQLSEEGAVQLFFDRLRMDREPILGAVGVLQFEVVQHRLRSEYGAPIELDRLPYQHARWLEGEVDIATFETRGYSTCVLDVEDRPLVLFESEWAMQRAEKENPKVKFIAAVQPGRSARSAA
ncbi:MAG: peptide-chain-release factor 3 [Myxococcales bacterium]|nr:peptide-chain-release factor 3 [Myxococcales bacterium]